MRFKPPDSVKTLAASDCAFKIRTAVPNQMMYPVQSSNNNPYSSIESFSKWGGGDFGIFRALHCTLFLFGTNGYDFQEPRVRYVFTLSRLKMEGSGEPRFAAVRFTVPGPVCGLVAVRFTVSG